MDKIPDFFKSGVETIAGGLKTGADKIMDGVKVGTSKVAELIPGQGKDAQNATAEAGTSAKAACKCQHISIDNNHNRYLTFDLGCHCSATQCGAPKETPKPDATS